MHDSKETSDPKAPSKERKGTSFNYYYIMQKLLCRK